jgi:hypothetical protein
MIKTITIHSRTSLWTGMGQTDELEVDADDLGKEIENKCNELEKEGFKIKKITPIDSGNMSNGTGAYITESVLITAIK